MTERAKTEELLQELSNSDESIEMQVASLFRIYSEVIGSEKMVLKAGKLGALTLLRSENLGEKILALQKLVFEDPTLEKAPGESDYVSALDDIENTLANVLARKVVEERLEKKISDKMEERQQEYVKEIQMQVLREEQNLETPQNLKKYALLEKMEQRKLQQSVMELLRPTDLTAIVGQDRAVEAMRSKLASPYPQHLILYGPPGVGKTTAARLAFKVAKLLKFTPFASEAPFIEVDGTTLRWDPRDITNPLLGSVHDPIYQGARKDFADGGVPEPKPGLVTDAHGGILFIDEIGEMDTMLQNKLLKVLEDKRVYFESAYYDPSDDAIPKYIHKLFQEGAPADFILIGATTRRPEDISPAIRSRCAEIFFDPLTPDDIKTIVMNAAEKLSTKIADTLPQTISEYTIEGRKAVNLLADAYSRALYKSETRENVFVTAEDIYQVAQISRLTPYISRKAADKAEVGRIFGLGVLGYIGSVIEIEAIAFPVQNTNKGTVRFNETAGSMAKDSVFNALAVVRKITGIDPAGFDIHVNVIGGGQIDGPSAGLAITAVIISALTGRALWQNLAVTGEVSIQGRIRAVGGVLEKAYGAKQAEIKTVIIPKENEQDIPQGHLGLAVCPLATVEEAIKILFVD